MNGCSKRYLRATSRLRPLGHGRKSDVQISNGHPGDGLCYLGDQVLGKVSIIPFSYFCFFMVSFLNSLIPGTCKGVLDID